jgi:hypothetical protein
LIHELHACADVAQRRGVAVDIETAAQLPGTEFSGARPPAVPPEGRRAITDLAIAVLVNAISRVRVTVTGTVDGVIVSLVSDSPADPDLPRGPARLVVDSQRDGQSLWVEARWNTT